MPLHVEPATEAPGVSAVPGGQERLRDAELRDAEELLARLLVVIGSHGRSGIRAALLGSVSSTVAARAPCPCVIVPPTAGGRLDAM
jgi:hypothetical protein